MSRALIATVFATAVISLASNAFAAGPASLDDLLEQTKSVHQHEDQANAERDRTPEIPRVIVVTDITR